MTASETAILEPKFVGNIEGTFLVPAYQRGYRWGPMEITHLLKDLEASRGSTYYLQPIVVRRIADDRFELIDGQQRLTSLYLLLSAIKAQGIRIEIPFSLEYETRDGSAEFLKTLGDDFSSIEDSVPNSNIDFFHMYHARRIIDEWFDKKPLNSRFVSASKLFQHLSPESEREPGAKVIWYEVETEDVQELFRRLNVGRIPLTNAELIKASLLTSFKNMDGADRSTEVASQWDTIERELQNPDLWAFLTGFGVPRGTRIDLIFEALAGAESRSHGESEFFIFDTLRERLDNPVSFWNETLDIHSTLQAWYEDRDLYHHIGYLTALGVTIARLVEISRRSTATEFRNLLRAEICSKINTRVGELGDVEYDSARGRDKNILFLFNVETVRTSPHAGRYPFRAHADQRWSVEHIHAQNAEGLVTVEQWTVWLSEHLTSMQRRPDISDAVWADFKDRIDAFEKNPRKDSFRELEQQIRDALGDGTSDIHTIDNLALLSRNENSAIGNSVFEVKRRMLLEKDADGAFIPPATRNAFLKYYSLDDNQQLHLWTDTDRLNYLGAMEKVLSPYLKESD